MKIDVPCKINLGLYVLRKRPDGYHDLETCFLPISHCTDTIEMEKGGEISTLEMEGADFQIEADKNLCMKAFRMLQADFALPETAIRLYKRIPSGAGLGGGSADAAGVLQLTNELFQLHLSVQQLQDYAARLGSDVPFFVTARPAIGEGRGERLTPIEVNLNNLYISIFKPNFSISTAEAYARIKPQDGRPALREILALPPTEWRHCLPNDFEAALFPKHPQLADIQAKYYAAGACYAALSGSGSAMFALAENPIRLASFFNGTDLV